MSIFDELKSIEVRHIPDRPADCTIEYDKIAINKDEDLDFEIKYKYGDVRYNVRRVLHYFRDSRRTRLGGMLRLMEPKDVYEVEIYKKNR